MRHLHHTTPLICSLETAKYGFDFTLETVFVAISITASLPTRYIVLQTIFLRNLDSTWSGCLGRFFDSGTDLESFDSITHHSRHDLTTYSRHMSHFMEHMESLYRHLNDDITISIAHLIMNSTFFFHFLWLFSRSSSLILAICRRDALSSRLLQNTIDVLPVLCLGPAG